MPDESFRLETNGIEQALAAWPREMQTAISQEIQQLLATFDGREKERLRSGPPFLRVRKGTLWNSLKFKMLKWIGDKISGVAYADARHALQQEFGGTNTPKSGNYLAIPLNRTPSGVPRDASPLDYIKVGDASNINNPNFATRKGLQEDSHGLTRGYSQQTFVLPALRRPNLIVYLRRKRAPPLPIFVLVKKVTNKPRMGFFATWQGMESERTLAAQNILNKAAELLAK